MPEPDTPFRKKCRITWAALIKAVYEVDPLKCPSCGGAMKIVGFIEKRQTDAIQKILRHCGLWKNVQPRPPPLPSHSREPEVLERFLDYGFSSQPASELCLLKKSPATTMPGRSKTVCFRLLHVLFCFKNETSG
jgi:hypothetical protein